MAQRRPARRPASRGKKGGGGGFIGSVFMALLIGSLIFVWFKTPTGEFTNVVDWAQKKDAAVKEWVGTWDRGSFFRGIDPSRVFGSGIGIPGSKATNGSVTGGTLPGVSSASKSDVLNKLNSLATGAEQSVDYKRTDWKHWTDVRSCWTTREAVLARDAVAGSLTFKTATGSTTTDVNKACEIVSGKWNDPYAGKTVTNPRSLDVDHMIPLSYTASHGGQVWDSKRKQDYANNLAPGHLLAVDASANRQKGDKGPSQWKPSNTAYHCDYAKNWVSVANTWGIKIPDADKSALSGMLATCKS